MNYRYLDWRCAWASLYMFMVLALSYLNVGYNVIIFSVFLLFALPFVKIPEYYIGIAMLLDTISYYFVGVSEGVFSITTILFFICLCNIFIYKKGRIVSTHRCTGALTCLCLITVISYYHSVFHYTNGMFRLLYLLIITMVLGNLIRIDIALLGKILPKLALTMTLGYLVTVLLTRSFIEGRLTIANEVNTNTFGMSCAQIATVLCVSYMISEKKSISHLCAAVIIVGLAFFSGSRGAILAFIAATVTVVLLRAIRIGRITGYLVKLSIVAIVLICMVAVLSPIFGIDISRFSASEAFSKGGSGTTRLLIITTLFPLIIAKKYYIWGYGPGHECSRRLIEKYVFYNFSHTHNTFFESFGELGVGGLFFTVICTITSLKNVFRCSKDSDSVYIVFAMFVCLLINGMAESYFCDAFFWLMLMVCRNPFYIRNEE